jgi:hypothetical protein
MTPSPTVKDLLVSRALAMAAHDGAPVSVVHLTGAAHQLQAELIAARDHQVAHYRAPPVLAIAAPAQPDTPNEAAAEPPAPQKAQEPDAPAADAGESRAVADEDDAS